MENSFNETNKKKTQLIDELFFIADLLDDLYQYHPSNPKQVNVEETYKELSLRKVQIENELNNIKIEQ